MVRMENPSPIQVGREFVRQYYTLLNKAPDMLHRFYGVNSSYVHGSRYCDGEPEEGVIGQGAIHKKITSLQFKECHTKVRQVDAHSTIGSGVVVQVIGELSNNRKPLRRFMQTFVLAPQGDNPYKFYVHNDIFRYEDEVFQDEIPQDRLDEEQESEEDENAVQQPPQTQYDGSYYQPQATPIISNGIEQRIESAPIEPQQASTTPVTSAPTSPASGTQSYDHPQEPSQSPTPDTEPKETTESPVYSPSSGIEEEHSQSEPAPSDSADTLSGTAPDTTAAPAPEAEPVAQTFSWAALASKNTPMQHNTQQGTVVKVNQSDQVTPSESMPQRPPPNRNQKGPMRSGYREDNDRGSGDRGGDGNMRRPTRYPDNQQIFVGNLPYDITDVDLREHFSEFGEIIDIRINHSHTSNPSFGFIIFEDQKSAEEVLQQMPTTFKNNKRINIEEKKQRAMPRDRDGRRMGPGMDMRRDNPRGGNRPQQRGPPRRDRGGSREGQRPGNFATRR